MVKGQTSVEGGGKLGPGGLLEGGREAGGGGKKCPSEVTQETLLELLKLKAPKTEATQQDAGSVALLFLGSCVPASPVSRWSVNLQSIPRSPPAEAQEGAPRGGAATPVVVAVVGTPCEPLLPGEDLRAYAYEGDGSSAGSLSSTISGLRKEVTIEGEDEVEPLVPEILEVLDLLKNLPDAPRTPREPLKTVPHTPKTPREHRRTSSGGSVPQREGHKKLPDTPRTPRGILKSFRETSRTSGSPNQGGDGTAANEESKEGGERSKKIGQGVEMRLTGVSEKDRGNADKVSCGALGGLPVEMPCVGEVPSQKARSTPTTRRHSESRRSSSGKRPGSISSSVSNTSLYGYEELSTPC
ncbi:uncharacterized protein LOC125045331 [Penaeus chinensis]|uniref:uncharacterized protein LOC125045331 n=1 Tax=Penaeus chinensis TaxID=139456 RepID=UPI001FB62E07|nr:uncharacterized protein LOC125045331 [Penaeus chinensis]